MRGMVRRLAVVWQEMVRLGRTLRFMYEVAITGIGVVSCLGTGVRKVCRVLPGVGDGLSGGQSRARRTLCSECGAKNDSMKEERPDSPSIES